MAIVCKFGIGHVFNFIDDYIAKKRSTFLQQQEEIKILEKKYKSDSLRDIDQDVNVILKKGKKQCEDISSKYGKYVNILEKRNAKILEQHKQRLIVFYKAKASDRIMCCLKQKLGAARKEANIFSNNLSNYLIRRKDDQKH